MINSSFCRQSRCHCHHHNIHRKSWRYALALNFCIAYWPTLSRLVTASLGACFCKKGKAALSAPDTSTGKKATKATKAHSVSQPEPAPSVKATRARSSSSQVHPLTFRCACLWRLDKSISQPVPAPRATTRSRPACWGPGWPSSSSTTHPRQEIVQSPIPGNPGNVWFFYVQLWKARNTEKTWKKVATFFVQVKFELCAAETP